MEKNGERLFEPLLSCLGDIELKKSVIAALATGGILLLILIFFDVSRSTGGLSVAAHLNISLGLGIIISLLLGVGLMSLIFYSSRRGYDDHSQDDDQG